MSVSPFFGRNSQCDYCPLRTECDIPLGPVPEDGQLEACRESLEVAFVGLAQTVARSQPYKLDVETMQRAIGSMTSTLDDLRE